MPTAFSALEGKVLTMKVLKMMISALLIAVMLCSGAMAAYKANVITSSMAVYNASKDYVGALPFGTAFEVEEISSNGNWAKINYKGHVGYASMQNILFQNRIKAVCTEDASMRFVTESSYKLNLAFNATVAKGTTVYVVGYYNGYLLIENASGNGLGVVKASCFKKAG